MSWRELFWGWHGRINRAQFFVGLIIVQIGTAMAAYAAVWLVAPSLSTIERGHLFHEVSAVAALPFAVSLFHRRLHDVGYDARFLVVVLGLLVAGYVLEKFAPQFELSPWFVVLSAPFSFLGLGLLIALGSERENQFGPRPAPGLPVRW